jgi:hypothetical protein
MAAAEVVEEAAAVSNVGRRDTWLAIVKMQMEVEVEQSLMVMIGEHLLKAMMAGETQHQA